MPTFSQAASAVSSNSTPVTPSKGFWSRQFIIASPNPSQRPEGWQLDRAPMCPCHDCWENESPYHVPRPKKVKNTPEKMATSSVASTSTHSFIKRSPLKLLKKRISFDSIASDLRTLHYTTTATTIAMPETPASSRPPSVSEKN
ncbi:hypothetical protein CMQ_610 [Grosmannia clavigera kw1407]|uniref:Uncharacterized protein n=1 Tax=Grosmannia clavigera (strain kw1407 / UAMH 11150) TaxID=655863 RepID=F0XD34_GROCL|nr:uncharacterized protein CMQ_610 [Grosmannia clavigera kw1407]EFX03682.1 hypothetical protein CMQ_610 [Grosmannia clavigera kw1407]